MKHRSSDFKLWSNLFFRLLPYQVLLLMIDASNGIVDSICSSNFIGQTGMNAIGLYSPLNHFLFAMSIMLVSGSQLLMGKAMGRNKMDSVKNYFSTDLIIAVLISCCISVLMIIASLTDATRVLTDNIADRQGLNQYLLSQSFGIPALVLGQQLFSFLSMENQRKRTMVASLVCIVTNAATDLLLVGALDMGTFGLGLGSSIALWVFCAVMLQYYISGKSQLEFSLRAMVWKDSLTIFRCGYTGAISRFVEMFRCLVVNALILKYVGNSGISAFAAVNSVMAVFWPIAFGMVAVTRMLLSITIGEEDRQSLTDIMRVVLQRGTLLITGIAAFIILMASPLTNMFYHDPSDPVYAMTMMGFRILPLCMPLAVVSLNMVCYSQAMEKKFLANLLPIVDGAVSVIVFSFILIPVWHMNGLYIANILNGFVCAAIIIAYSIKHNHHFPRSMEDLLVIPENFGTEENERIDIGVSGLKEVPNISRQVIDFCRTRGIDERRSYFSGLAMEEIAGNIFEHGFQKDKRRHEVALRVVHKDNDVILRILDDCRQFNPMERIKSVDSSDITSNIGIRLVLSIVKDVQYQNLLGLNVLTLRL